MVATKKNGVWKIGEKYMIRLVTMYWIGKLKTVTPAELVLSNASWIADTGRYHKAILNGELNEVEFSGGEAIVGRGAIVDAVVWNHDLPKESK